VQAAAKEGLTISKVMFCLLEENKSLKMNREIICIKSETKKRRERRKIITSVFSFL
jgi:hypothetical protein